MKKRVLFVSHGLNIGGAESSLIGYLHALSKKEDIETDLFLYRHEGELMKHIPKGVTLLSEKASYACLATPIKNVLKKGRFCVALGRFIGKRKATAYQEKNKHTAEKSSVGLEYSHKYTKRFMPKISRAEYDLVVSFLTPHYFAAEKVKAGKKVAFIHTDYTYITIDVESELKMWDAYDVIAAVSESVSDGFVKLFPSLKSKVEVIENINPVSLIKSRADELVPTEEMPNDGAIKLLSVGRFCDAKNFESIPYKLMHLKQSGVNAKWYIIGFGNDSLIRKSISETGTADDVIILGKKVNPYPYIKHCDVYVQPSRYEGKAVTVLEAQILERPVVIANYSTSAAQLTDGVDGIIAPMDDEGFAAALAALIAKPKEMEILSANCKERDYSNAAMADRLIALI